MILGLSLDTFTFLHVVLSLIGIMAGFILVALMLSNAPIAGWNAFFLISTILTSVTGFFLPSDAFGLARILGLVSLIALAIALFAIYGRRLSGVWRPIYVVGVALALYLNVFVAIAQSFQKFAYLHQFAPNGSEPALVVTQTCVLILFLILGIAALRRYHPPLRA